MHQDFLALSSNAYDQNIISLAPLKLSKKFTKVLQTSLNNIKAKQQKEKKIITPLIPPFPSKRKAEYELTLKEGVKNKKLKLDKVRNMYAFTPNERVYGEFCEEEESTQFKVELISTAFNEEIKPIKLAGIEKFIVQKSKKEKLKQQINSQMKCLDQLNDYLKVFEANLTNLMSKDTVKIDPSSLTCKDKIQPDELLAKPLVQSKIEYQKPFPVPAVQQVASRI